MSKNKKEDALRLIANKLRNDKDSIYEVINNADEKWWKLRNDKGDNLLHIFAKHHYKIFLKYASTQAGIKLV